jgi:hypothetical protein
MTSTMALGARNGDRPARSPQKRTRPMSTTPTATVAAAHTHRRTPLKVRAAKPNPRKAMLATMRPTAKLGRRTTRTIRAMAPAVSARRATTAATRWRVWGPMRPSTFFNDDAVDMRG